MCACRADRPKATTMRCCTPAVLVQSFSKFWKHPFRLTRNAPASTHITQNQSSIGASGCSMQTIPSLNIRRRAVAAGLGGSPLWLPAAALCRVCIGVRMGGGGLYSAAAVAARPIQSKAKLQLHDDMPTTHTCRVQVWGRAVSPSQVC